MEDEQLEQLKKEAFSHYMSLTGNVTKSAKLADVSRTIVYNWLKDKNFKGMFDETRRSSITVLEDEANRRAVA